MKSIGGSLGYALGTFIVVPLIFWLANTFLLSGNRVNDNQVQHYIDDSVHLELKMPSHYDDHLLSRENESYWKKLTRKGDIGYIRGYIFYESNYKQYFNVITFDGFDIRKIYSSSGSGEFYTRDFNPLRYSSLYGFYLNGTVNKTQWKNPAYGSKENPYPVFSVNAISGPPNGGPMSQVKERFDVNDELNFQFVREYLDHFVSKKELTSLGLTEPAE